MLRTLGGLRLDETSFRREKPLLLLSYLALEGSQARPRLARLFWPEAADPANSLAQHLVRLRPLKALIEDGQWLKLNITCDAALMRQALRGGQWEAGLSHYGGTFLDGLNLGLGSDLEEWVLDTREALAAQAQSALLTLARQASEDRDFAGAAALAERCHTLPGASPLEEAELAEVYTLLARAGHAHAETVRREARDLGLSLSLPAPLPSDTPPKFHLLLALTDHLPAIRAALKVSAAELTRLRLAREQAGEAAHAEALAWLEAHPLETPLLHLEVARHLPVELAWLHYEAAKELWEEEDGETVARAAHHFADGELKQGYPARAARVLEGVKQTDEVKLLRAWGLIYSGRMPDALTALNDLPDNAETLSAQALALVKMTRDDEVPLLLRRIPSDRSANHALAEEISGYLAYRKNQLKDAKYHYQRSVDLWKLNNKQDEYIMALSLLTNTKIALGEATVELFDPILTMAEEHNHAGVLGDVYSNYGQSLVDVGNFDTAVTYLSRAITHFSSTENILGLATAFNNLGVSFHLQSKHPEAKLAYDDALDICSSTGNARLFGLIACNLSELEGDSEHFSGILTMLKEAGQDELCLKIQKNIMTRMEEDFNFSTA